MSDANYSSFRSGKSENNFVKIDSRIINQLSSVNLSGYDAAIIVADNFYEYSGKLLGYVKEGGSIFILPCSNGFFNQFKNSCSALQINSLVSASGNINSGKSTAMFDQIDFEICFAVFLIKPQRKKLNRRDLLLLQTASAGKKTAHFIIG